MINFFKKIFEYITPKPIIPTTPDFGPNFDPYIPVRPFNDPIF